MKGFIHLSLILTHTLVHTNRQKDTHKHTNAYTNIHIQTDRHIHKHTNTPKYIDRHTSIHTRTQTHREEKWNYKDVTREFILLDHTDIGHNATKELNWKSKARKVKSG